MKESVTTIMTQMESIKEKQMELVEMKIKYLKKEFHCVTSTAVIHS
jgi:hypothetical protein